MSNLILWVLRPLSLSPTLPSRKMSNSAQTGPSLASGPILHHNSSIMSSRLPADFILRGSRQFLGDHGFGGHGITRGLYSDMASQDPFHSIASGSRPLITPLRYNPTTPPKQTSGLPPDVDETPRSDSQPKLRPPLSKDLDDDDTVYQDGDPLEFARDFFRAMPLPRVVPGSEDHPGYATWLEMVNMMPTYVDGLHHRQWKWLTMLNPTTPVTGGDEEAKAKFWIYFAHYLHSLLIHHTVSYAWPRFHLVKQKNLLDSYLMDSTNASLQLSGCSERFDTLFFTGGMLFLIKGPDLYWFVIDNSPHHCGR